VSRRTKKRRQQQQSALAVVQGSGTDGPVALLKAKPPRGEASGVRGGAAGRMPPVSGFIDMDRQAQIRGVIKQFEEGSSFEQPAKLADAMLRDDRISGVLGTRHGAVLASELEVRGATDKRVPTKIAELVGGSDEQPGIFWEMFPKHAVAELLHWGGMIGIGVGELVWDTSDPNFWRMTLRVWHPQFLRWDYEKGAYFLTTRDGPIQLPSLEEYPHGDGKWIIYAPNGYREPWRHAFLRPLAMLYLSRQWTYRDWSRYSEKHGMPVDIFHFPEGAPEAEQQKMITDVANRGSETSLSFPLRGGDDEPQYKFEIKEAMGNSYQSFDRFISKLETDVAVLILGQNLTTEVQAGSRAAAQVHEGVQLLKLIEDSAIIDVLVDQGLRHWTRVNYGDEALTPRARFVVMEPADELKEAQTLEAIGAAVSSLELAGINVDKDAVAEQWGIPVQVDEDEDLEQGGGNPAAHLDLTPSAIAAIATVNEARAAQGLGPLKTEGGALDPDGMLTVSEFTAKNAATVAAAAAAESGKSKPVDPDAQPAGLAPGRAPGAPPTRGDESSDEEDPTETLRRGLIVISESVNQRLHARLSTRATPGVAGHKRTAAYADALKAASKLRAKQALSHDLKGILDDVNAATSFDDLKRRVVRRYKGMSGQALARVVERANIMAHMAGRLGATEEI
jgi:phage gp29-like protein